MKKNLTFLLILSFMFIFVQAVSAADDLKGVKERGVLRHLGVSYANFNTGAGDGLSTELIQMFARHLGVKYEFVETSWKTVINDLTGKQVKPDGKNVIISGDAPIKGDLIANGLTILPWRQKVLDYSIPTFPTQIWLITTPTSGIRPIKPTGDINKDIAMVKKMLAGRTVLGKANTCLDPSLYQIKETGASPSSFDGGLNELAPAVINHAADTAILDVPDALVALEKWPGQVLVVGPVSPQQGMGVGFRKDCPELRKAFNEFYQGILKDGSYIQLIEKYYPMVFDYYPDFFNAPGN